MTSKPKTAIIEAKVGDWVKQSHGGYYQILRHTKRCAVIKQAFDLQLVYAKQSLRLDSFTVVLTDLNDYQSLEKEELLKIQRFFSDNPDKQAEFLRYTDTMLSLRDALLHARFKEAEWDFRQFSFYRCTANNVAFVVNLMDHGSHIGITYGFTSVADTDHLKRYGEANDDIKLRFSSVIKNEQDKIAVAATIKNVYDTYLHKSKDDILHLKKERQKQFLQKIADKLKPLGFKKKGAKWTRPLESDFCLEFEAQKSRWSDEYYFNVIVYHKDVQFPPCYGTRLTTNGKDIYNWQLMTDEELHCLLNEATQNILIPIINAPLTELGTEKEIWQGCTCKRNKCAACWVQKNLWEAAEAR